MARGLLHLCETEKDSDPARESNVAAPVVGGGTSASMEAIGVLTPGLDVDAGLAGTRVTRQVAAPSPATLVGVLEVGAPADVPVVVLACQAELPLIHRDCCLRDGCRSDPYSQRYSACRQTSCNLPSHQFSLSLDSELGTADDALCNIAY